MNTLAANGISRSLRAAGQRLLGLDGSEEAAEYRAVGADFIHGGQVQVQVADKAAIGVFVGFFADHDFIDQARSSDMRWRYPRHLHLRVACSR